MDSYFTWILEPVLILLLWTLTLISFSCVMVNENTFIKFSFLFNHCLCSITPCVTAWVVNCSGEKTSGVCWNNTCLCPISSSCIILNVSAQPTFLPANSILQTRYLGQTKYLKEWVLKKKCSYSYSKWWAFHIKEAK